MNTIQCGENTKQDCVIQKLSYFYPQYQILENNQKALYIIRNNALVLQNCTNTITINKDQIIFLQQGNYTIKTLGNEPCETIYIPL
ncbi:hypothetical protein ACGFFB_000199 [Proteus mirabilis]